MAKDIDSPGGRLRWARERTGIDAATMAKLEGLNDKTYRAYENGQNGFAKLAPAFAKRLDVPTDWLLSGGPAPDNQPPLIDVSSNATPATIETVPPQGLSRDMPMYGSALGAEEVLEGEAIEQTTLNRGEIVEYKRRPPGLAGRSDVYGLYVQGSSMSPRYEDGEIIFVESRRRPAIGEDGVIYLKMPGHEEDLVASVLVKRVVRKTANYLELEQYGPPRTFRIPMDRIERMDRVLSLNDLLG
jgi:phage repressor protein C with HTH and peptisase S24 domain